MIDTNTMKRYLDVLDTTTALNTRQPILSNVAMNGYLMTTDLDAFTRIKPASGYIFPETTASMVKLKKLVSGTTAEDLQFSGDHVNKNLVVNAGRLTTRLNTIDRGEFPAFPEIEYTQQWNTTLDVFREAVRRIGIAAAHYDAHNILTSVHFHFEGNAVELAATDGSRLHKISIPTPGTYNPTSINIPSGYLKKIYSKFKTVKGNPAVRVLFGMPPKIEGEAKTVHNPDMVQIDIGEEYSFVIRLLEGQYPKLNQLIPHDRKFSYTFMRQELIEALKAVKPFANERTMAGRFILGEERATITVSTPDVGDSEYTLGCSGATLPRPVCKCEPRLHEGHLTYCPLNGFTGAMITGFNINYLMDMLESSSGETIQLSSNGYLHPFVMTDGTGWNFTGLIMPVQLK